MKSWVIAIPGHEYSQSVADRCIESAARHGVKVEKFSAVTKHTVPQVLAQQGLRWSWADMNTNNTVCALTGLEQFPYSTKSLDAKMACSLSHYMLWKQCVELDEPVLILEHDAVFVASIPEVEFKGAIQINDPAGGGYRGKYHSKFMQNRGTVGVHPLTPKRPTNSKIPDGFSGNSAYMIKPWAAHEFIQAFKNYGVWPNDATICLQLFPWLQELYPFVTVVKQDQSTSTK